MTLVLFRWFTVLLAGAATCLLFAQTPRFEGQRITGVEYRPADQPLDARDLQKVQTIRAGEKYSSDTIAETVDRLFATGRYRDIQVEAEPSGDGVLLRIVTEKRWFNGGLTVDGKIANPPSRGQLINITNLPLGMPFDEKQVDRAERNLRRVFESNGLYEARIERQLDRDDLGDQIHFTFTVKAGKRARYDTPVIRGDTKLSDDTIIGATGWRYRIVHIYKRVTAQRTRAAITNIQKKYQSKNRVMASIQIESLDYDRKRRRLKPTLRIDAGPQVKVQAVEAKVSQKTLRKYVPIFDERRVDRDLLVEGARNLRDYFQARGYYDVDIDFRQRQEGQDQVAIEYVIAQGQRYKVVRADLEGNRYFNEDTLRERMFVTPASFRLWHGRYSESMRKKDEENIANLYRANGFRDVEVTSTVDRNYQGRAGDLAVVFHIHEGQQWFVESIRVEGVTALDRDSLVSRLASLEGQPYSDVNVAADRSYILAEYYRNGFPDASFEWGSSPGAGPRRVSLVYRITEGRRQFVRDVLITGLRTTRQRIVDRAIQLNPGDPLSSVSMLDSQKTLYDLGIFARVNPAIQNPEGDTENKYVVYDIEEARRYRLNLGFGAQLARFGPTANTLDSPAGGTGFSPRVSADLSRLNFLGLGHVVTVRGIFSNIQKRGSINYLAPRFHNVDGRNITFTLLYDDSRDVRTFASKRQEASVQLSQQFSKPTTGLFRFTYRRVSTSDVAIPTLLVPALLQPVRIGLLSANIVQDRRDNPGDPTRGIFNTVDVGLSTRYFGSQRSFLRALGRNATYYRLTRNVVFARQTTVGMIFPFAIPAGVARDQAIPLPERFFGGGSTSHRGFPENQAGPRDIGTPAGPDAPATQPTGFPLGGNALFFNTLELRFPLIGENIRGVLFHDAGNIYSTISRISFRQSQRNDQDFDYMVHAVGFGIRYKTPVGPVRADLAYSINPPSFVGFKGTIQDLLSCKPGVPVDQLPSQCRGVRQSTSHFQFFFSIGQTF